MEVDDAERKVRMPVPVTVNAISNNPFPSIWSFFLSFPLIITPSIHKQQTNTYNLLLRKRFVFLLTYLPFSTSLTFIPAESATTTRSPRSNSQQTSNIMSEPLSKVDSAVQGLSSSPPAKDAKTRRQSSAAAPGVWNVNDLGKL